MRNEIANQSFQKKSYSLSRRAVQGGKFTGTSKLCALETPRYMETSTSLPTDGPEF